MPRRSGHHSHMQETPEQRRAKLAERARALADRKEAARAAEAQARLEQQFVESCDALRQMESRKRLQLINQQRTGQVCLIGLRTACMQCVLDRNGFLSSQGVHSSCELVVLLA